MTDRVREACEACFGLHRNDCSGFVRAVGAKLGVVIDGLANDIVDTIRGGGAWRELEDGQAAETSARAGKLVLAGLRGDEQYNRESHGHVVVVVDGPLERGQYPTGYWGSSGGGAAESKTINWAWTNHDRDRITYAEHDLQTIP